MQQSREFSRFNICVLIGMGKARKEGKSSQKIGNCLSDNSKESWKSTGTEKCEILRSIHDHLTRFPAFLGWHQHQRFPRFHFWDWYRIEAIYLGIWFHHELLQAKFPPTPATSSIRRKIFDELGGALPKAHSPQIPLLTHVYNKFA